MIKNTYIAFLVILIGILELVNAQQTDLKAAKFRAENLLPSPQHLELHNQLFKLSQNTLVHSNANAKNAIAYFQNKLFLASGYYLKNSNKQQHNLITFTSDTSIAPEGYSLEINNAAITVQASDSSGFFYGVQTLLQLLDPNIYQPKSATGKSWNLIGLKIQDSPKHRWRSFMLDSGREYQSLSFIKKYLDHMAMLKMNVFHWHLTEGQGWRIEIKSYPKLTEIGAHVSEGSSKGRYYTQQDIKEIVSYAKERCITVVPEIDIPGHSEAALTAYPEHSCFKEKPSAKMTFSATLFCGGRESTYAFLETIFDEVCALFPSQYIHIGGDEAPKERWKACSDCQAKIKKENLHNEHELQVYFSNRIARYLKTKDRKAICWGDIIHEEGPDLEDNIVVYWWNWRRHKTKTLDKSIEKRIPVICGTNYYNYLNFPVTPWSKYTKARTFDLKKVYQKKPFKFIRQQNNQCRKCSGNGHLSLD